MECLSEQGGRNGEAKAINSGREQIESAKNTDININRKK